MEAPELYVVDTSPVPPGDLWLAFTPDTPEQVARQAFVAKYGRIPAQVWITPNLVLAGPVKERPE